MNRSPRRVTTPCHSLRRNECNQSSSCEWRNKKCHYKKGPFVLDGLDYDTTNEIIRFIELTDLIGVPGAEQQILSSVPSMTREQVRYLLLAVLDFEFPDLWLFEVIQSLTRPVDLDQLLNIAAHDGYLNATKNLIALGADIQSRRYLTEEVRGSPYPAVLNSAVSGGQIGILQYLMSIGMSIGDGTDLLYHAAGMGQLEMVKYLISLGTNFHHMNEIILLHAVENGQLAIVQYLVSLGADVNARDMYAEAVANEHMDVAAYLESVGADIFADME